MTGLGRLVVGVCLGFAIYPIFAKGGVFGFSGFQVLATLFSLRSVSVFFYYYFFSKVSPAGIFFCIAVVSLASFWRFITYF